MEKPKIIGGNVKTKVIKHSSEKILLKELKESIISQNKKDEKPEDSERPVKIKQIGGN